MGSGGRRSTTAIWTTTSCQKPISGREKTSGDVRRSSFNELVTLQPRPPLTGGQQLPVWSQLKPERGTSGQSYTEGW